MGQKSAEWMNWRHNQKGGKISFWARAIFSWENSARDLILLVTALCIFWRGSRSFCGGTLGCFWLNLPDLFNGGALISGDRGLQLSRNCGPIPQSGLFPPPLGSTAVTPFSVQVSSDFWDLWDKFDCIWMLLVFGADGKHPRLNFHLI